MKLQMLGLNLRLNHFAKPLTAETAYNLVWRRLKLLVPDQ